MISNPVDKRHFICRQMVKAKGNKMAQWIVAQSRTSIMKLRFSKIRTGNSPKFIQLNSHCQNLLGRTIPAKHSNIYVYFLRDLWYRNRIVVIKRIISVLSLSMSTFLMAMFSLTKNGSKSDQLFNCEIPHLYCVHRWTTNKKRFRDFKTYF